MHQEWLEFVTEQGAVIDEGRVIAWRDHESSIYSIDDTCLCELSPLGLIGASGEDAQKFLHGQFTNDLNQVTPAVSQLSSYCTPKGRMLSIFRVYRDDAGYHLILPRGVIEPTIGKLNMFKLMSKVEIGDDSDQRVVFGIAGPAAESALDDSDVSAPAEVNGCAHDKGVTLIRLSIGERTRILLVANLDVAISLWGRLAAKLPVATSNLWDLHDIHAGIPQITADISEAFTPQMTNLELIGGISFKKGCYPGQEIVARTHYLGKPNRRMYRIHVAGADVPQPGTNIFSPEDANQPVGKIVIAQQAAAGHSSALAVLRTAKADAENLHLGDVTGPNISTRPLPYSLDQEIE